MQSTALKERTPTVAEATALINTSTFTVEVWNIEPAVARHLFDNFNRKNRAFRLAKSRDIAKDIRQHRWRFTGDTIKIGDDKQVRDGQHRLRACDMAGRAIKSLVVLGVPTEHFDAMDTGQGKTPADIFGLAGVPYAQQTAGAANWLERLTNGSPLGDRNRRTAPFLLDAYRNRYIGLDDFVKEVIGKNGPVEVLNSGVQGGGFSVPMVAAFYWLFNEKNPKLASEFFKELTKGPDGKLRGLLAEVRSRRQRLLQVGGRMKDADMALLLVMAWNKFASAKGGASVPQGLFSGAVATKRKGDGGLFWPGVFPNPEKGSAPKTKAVAVEAIADAIEMGNFRWPALVPR